MDNIINIRNKKGQFIKKFDIKKEDLQNLYLTKKLSQGKIALIFGCSQGCIHLLLNKYRIPRREKKCFKSHPEIILTEIQQQVIDGALLGDGCISNSKIGNCQFIYLTSNYSHTEYIGEFLKSMLTNECKKPKTKDFFDKRTNKMYRRHYIKTQNNITFSKLRKKWYPSGRKEIPKDLILTPLICLIWYIGDGCINSKEQVIKLSTNAFDKKDIENILLLQLKGFNPRLRLSETGLPVVYIPRITIRHFLNYIGNCPIPDLAYKWRIKEYKNKKYEKGEVKNHKPFVNEFVRLHKSGMSCYAIAKKYGIDLHVVKYYLKKNGVYIAKNKGSKR